MPIRGPRVHIHVGVRVQNYNHLQCKIRTPYKRILFALPQTSSRHFGSRGQPQYAQGPTCKYPEQVVPGTASHVVKIPIKYSSRVHVPLSNPMTAAWPSISRPFRRAAHRIREQTCHVPYVLLPTHPVMPQPVSNHTPSHPKSCSTSSGCGPVDARTCQHASAATGSEHPTHAACCIVR